MQVLILVSHKVLVLLVLTLALTVNVNSYLLQLPEMYLDRFAFWSVNGIENGPIPNGYNFTTTWQKTQQGVHQTALGLYNLQTGLNAILSYEVSFLTINKVAATLNLALVGVDSRIVYMAFSLLVLPFDSPQIQLLEVTRNNLTFTTVNNYTVSVPSVKFNLSAGGYHLHHFYEWITGDMLYYNSFYNYWSYSYRQIKAETNSIQISFWVSYQIYMTGFKINILLVKKNMGSHLFFSHGNQTEYLEYRPMNFTLNLGINPELYDTQNSHHCFHGLYVIDLYVIKWPLNDSSFILFDYNNTDIIGTSFSTVYGFRIDSFCYGMCPSDFMVNGTCQKCRATIPYCEICSSDIVCKKCFGGLFQMNVYNTSCDCPQRKIGNMTTKVCDSCPYDCLTCDASGNCLSCSQNLDFRTLNSITKRCVPIQGYYESSQPVSFQCHSSCVVCTSSEACQPCPLRTIRATSSNACNPCPYDCLTCDASGNCLTCSQSLDYRTFNSITKRCVPIQGYYERNLTQSGKCSLGCKHCLSFSSCQFCHSRYILFSQQTQPCSPCPYDCLTCDKQGNCLSCSSQTDFRELTNSRCHPIIGYYETNSTVCGKCSNFCNYCFSSTQCYSCIDFYFLQVGFCQQSCSTRFYTILSNKTCLPCPFDCLTCTSEGACITCASSDNRQFNITSKRCDPKNGYFQSGSSVSSPCPSSCSSCTSLSVCSSCSEGYQMEGNSCKAISSGMMMYVVAGIVGFHVLIGVFQGIMYGKNRMNILRVQTNLWKQKDPIPFQQLCKICQGPGKTFLASCGHSFHPNPNCVIAALQHKPVCPEGCQARLTTRQLKHSLYCNKCRLYVREVTIDQLKRIVNDENQESDVVCDECRTRLRQITRLNGSGSENNLVQDRNFTYNRNNPQFV